jgi:hypothetical protein
LDRRDFTAIFRFSVLTVPFFNIGVEVKAKAKVLDVLHLTGRTASTEDSRTILSEKEFKELLRQLKEGEKDPKILSARQKLENLKTLWEN